MNTYEICFKANPQYENNPLSHTMVDAKDYPSAIKAWRGAYPNGQMVWAKLKTLAPIIDRRLPRDED